MAARDGNGNGNPSIPDIGGVGTYFLGRYRVVDEIGIGGMASVHLARMDGPGGFQKWVAIKRIHGHLVEDDSFIEMFLDEARVAARISHPNVATVFDLGKHEDTYWIAMEYLHGEPLREVMRQTEETGQPMPPEIACRVIADAAEGLHAAHELLGKNGEKLGLVHRDVTPHNLFVTYDGSTKIVDFGIAKFSSRMANTRAGTLKGKLAYMSPEQVHGETLDRRTDIFALGVVLWELTTGQRLFRMDNDLDTLAKVQECNVPRPSTIVRGYPIDLEKIVMKALAKNRAERFRTARELSRALQSLLMRRGLFIASDEVANYIQSIFQDRIQKRDAHLRWAADVTQTINVDGLRQAAAQSEPPPPSRDSTVPPEAPGRPPAPRPAAGIPAGSTQNRAFSTTAESVTAPRAGHVPTARPQAQGGGTVPVVIAGAPVPYADIDDGPTIQAPPDMTIESMAGGLQDSAEMRGARAAMMAAMMEEEAAHGGFDDDGDDTVVQGAGRQPLDGRSPSPAPAAGRPAPANAGPGGAPVPAAGRPAEPMFPVTPAPPLAGPSYAEPPRVGRSYAVDTRGTPGMAPPPLMQPPRPPEPPMFPPTGPSHISAAMAPSPFVAQAQESQPLAPPVRPPAPSPQPRDPRNFRTVARAVYTSRPPPWIVALGSATVVFVVAAIVIFLTTGHKAPPAKEVAETPSASASGSAPSAGPAPAPAGTTPPGGMGPFRAARAAFASTISGGGAELSPPVPPSEPPRPPAPAVITATATPPATAAAPATAATAVRPTPATPAAAPPRPASTPAPAKGTGGAGTLTVICFPVCDHVYDNGKDMGVSPVWRRDVPSGEHHLKLVTSTPQATKNITVVVAPGEDVVKKVPLQ